MVKTIHLFSNIKLGQLIWPDFCSALNSGGGLRRLVCIIPGFGPFRCPAAQGPVQTLRALATRPTGTPPIPGPSNPGRACAARRDRSCTRRRRPRPWRCRTSRRPCRSREHVYFVKSRWTLSVLNLNTFGVQVERRRRLVLCLCCLSGWLIS